MSALLLRALIMGKCNYVVRTSSDIIIQKGELDGLIEQRPNSPNGELEILDNKK